MIELTSPLGIEATPDGGWALVLWMGKPFDYSTPFRRIVLEIAESFGPESARSLRLPAPEQDEDFIEGSLQFRGDTITVYWEHSLSYLFIKADNAAVLHAMEDRIRPLIT